MKHKIILLIFISTLATGCSDAPSESALAEVIQSSVQEELNKRLKTMSMLGVGEMAKAMGVTVEPNSVSIEKVTIEDQMKKENGDYVSKITYVLSVDNNSEKYAARITTTKIEGELKIINIEDI
ncbi:MAG: hypothetical protein IBX56_05500 [Methylomicrobium sp.]|nr:hypothetical protein [Methylomicrobium sp.]